MQLQAERILAALGIPSNCIALDAAKNVYVAGRTQSSDFPGVIHT